MRPRLQAAVSGFFVPMLAGLLALSACGGTPRGDPATSLPAIQTTQPAFFVTPAATRSPTVAFTPAAPLLTPTLDPGQLERPAFLAWPLPPSVGLARISQYPDTAWTWNYLGLNAGYACPPMFGYLLNLDSLAYWRDGALPEAQDKAQADPHNFEMVACYAGHHGTDIKAPAGTPVYAAADGKVQEWQLNGLNSMIVLKHCLGGAWDAAGRCLNGRQWYTTYMHLVPAQDLLRENADVVQGAVLGAIYDQTINSHLHLEVGRERRSAANFVNPWGQDAAPWLGCMWLDRSVCAVKDPRDWRLALSMREGKLFLKRGNDEPFEIPSPPGLVQMRLWEDRLFAIDAQGDLLFWEVADVAGGQTLAAGGQTLAANVLEVQAVLDRVAMLDDSRRLWVKESGWGGAWQFQAEEVQSFSLSGHRLGYLAGDGRLFAKEGPLENAWVPITGGVLAFQLVDNRLAYLDQQYNLYANEGNLLAEYQQMGSEVRAFQVTNLRLGMIDASGSLFVKEGNLRAGWLLQAQAVASFQLADDRLLALGDDGTFRIKVGNLYQAWQNLRFPGLREAFFGGPVPVWPPGD
ncbi:MAG: M23 family metallopeptidase [Chloroflexota bacterium]